MRNLILILGDQLSDNNPALDNFDSSQDRILMIEAAQESTHVWSHKARIVMFLSAMRHFAQRLELHYPNTLTYLAINAHTHNTMGAALIACCQQDMPKAIICQHPGDWRLKQDLEEAALSVGLAVNWTQDRHFYATIADFSTWVAGKKQIRMEFFYRWMRDKTGILMQGKAPEGGEWNYDSNNRHSIPKQGLGWLPPPVSFVPDATTHAVITLVQTHFSEHPGSIDTFAYAVTSEQAQAVLTDFIEHRLAAFGTYQDAMWTDEPYLFHSLLSAAMNMQLIHPQQVIDAVLVAYRTGQAPLNSVEGFVRQILGWREFMRGIYWHSMPNLAQVNHFNHRRPLPDWFWTGKTDMHCLHQVISQTLETGYAHHIQRLMVMGLYSTLAELHPQRVSDWFHAVYVDATDWVQRPNVIGMALYANGGLFTSKPYVASGAYIDKMSNYCQGCRFKPKEKLGSSACPITQLYWRFLIKHQAELSANPRTSLMVTHVNKMTDADKLALVTQAEQHLA